jgi:hypothetical protein
LKYWRKNEDGVLTNLQRNSNGALIKTLEDLNSPPGTEPATAVTTACLMEDTQAIRNYRKAKGSLVLTEILPGSNIIICHQQVADTSI